jgi:glucose-6-phosphate 1-epimerase
LSGQDISKVSIKGLEQIGFTDKVGGVKEKADEGTAITFDKETDRVYSKADRNITVVEGGKTKFEVTRDSLPDVVVWNPWVEKSKGMADFGPADGYKKMVCVEAGSVAEWNKLEGGDTWEGGQRIKAL